MSIDLLPKFRSINTLGDILWNPIWTITKVTNATPIVNVYADVLSIADTVVRIATTAQIANATSA